MRSMKKEEKVVEEVVGAVVVVVVVVAVVVVVVGVVGLVLSSAVPFDVSVVRKVDRVLAVVVVKLG